MHPRDHATGGRKRARLKYQAYFTNNGVTSANKREVKEEVRVLYVRRADALLTRIGYSVYPLASAQKAPRTLRLLAKLPRSDDGRRFPSRSFVSRLRIKRFSRKMHLVAGTAIQFIPLHRYLLPHCVLIVIAGYTYKMAKSMFHVR